MSVQLPQVPVAHPQFISYLDQNPDTPLRDLVKPYKAYESKLREVFAQHRDHPALQDPAVNVVPIFAGQESTLKTRARDPLNDASDDKYIMPLKEEDRRANGSPATAQSLKEFRNNFNLFSEQSLADMDWDNVVAAGSSVVTSMLPVPEKYRGSKRSLREYYHQKLAPSSDVDLFLVGLDEDSAAKKIAQIEECIRNSVLAETTTIRTKNAITIASQYPTRHIQIVLRLYSTVSEILTGFDIDSSCFAYDGKQVWATPRGVTSFCSQINEVDLTRRSPSYETRLAKYAHRGFEVYFPELDRSRIDPTLFERSFVRTLGLARLLLLEKLPTETDRENYLNQRRIERGRPQLDFWARKSNRHPLPGNKKDDDPEDIPDWEFDDAVANYHTFTVPYGPKYHAKKIERLLFTKDMLLNAEWNKNDDRKVNLHRHPCFLGDVKSVVHDCCGECPKPTNDEERQVAEEEGKTYVSGEISFLKDDPGRQQIGSFNPLTEHDWTDMAYLGNTQILCEAIIDGDIDAVNSWLEQESNDVNHRDHSGRMPLHFAIICGQLEIVKALVNAGARITSRIADGFTSLHMAAACGRPDILKVIGEKSEANEEMEAEKEDKRKAAQKGEADAEMVDVGHSAEDVDKESSDEENSDEDSEDYEHSGDESDDDGETQGSYVKVQTKKAQEQEEKEATLDDPFGPDFFDFNVLSWDSPLSPVHVAILAGNPDCIETLVSLFGADPLLPVKIRQQYSYDANNSVLLPLVLACKTAHPDAPAVMRKLIDLGAKPSQADTQMISALHGSVILHHVEGLKTMMEYDVPSAKSALNFLTVRGNHYNASTDNPLLAAIRSGREEVVYSLLDAGASAVVSYEDFCKAFKRNEEVQRYPRRFDDDVFQKAFAASEQPVVRAVSQDMPSVVKALVEAGADVNSLNQSGGKKVSKEINHDTGSSLLDLVDQRIKSVEKDVEEYGGQQRVFPNTTRRFLVDGELETKQIEESGYEASVKALDLEFAKLVRDRLNRQQEEGRAEAWKKHAKAQDNDAKKQLETLLSDLKELRDWLVEKGAKTFDELHPDVKNDPNRQNNHYNFYGTNQHTDDVAAYKFKNTFQDPGAPKRKQDAYVNLFNAVWDGDVERVKALTLKPIDDGQEEPLPPIPITTQDERGNSTLSIAIGRKHQHLVRVILDIAQAQYCPEDDEGKKKAARRRYRIRGPEDSEDEDMDEIDDPDAIPITSEVVNNEFTIDDIGKLNRTVGSKISVADFITQPVSMALFKENQLDPENDVQNVSDWTPIENVAKGAIRSKWGYGGLFKWASDNNDLKLFKFLCHSVNEASSLTDDNSGNSSMSLTMRSELHRCIRDGKTPFVEEIITTTGTAMPVDVLMAKIEVPAERREKPRYYQGLKVYGKYKEDWAKQASGDRTVDTPKSLKFAPLLNEIHSTSTGEGSLRAMEFWLSDAAVRLYSTFGEKHMHDKRIASLTEDAGNWTSVVVKWMELRREQALHLAVLKTGDDESLENFKYVLGAFPDALDKKNKSGYSPLWLAFATQNVSAARLLIERGADQTTRDKAGNNILHALLSRISQNLNLHHHQQHATDESYLDQLEATLQLIDKRILADLFTERSSAEVSGVTPFAIWCTKDNPDTRVYAILEKYMPEDVYTMYDGSGKTPLHTLAIKDAHELLKTIINKRPHLLGLENGSGQTPFELAQTLFIQEKSTKPLIDRYDHMANIKGTYAPRKRLARGGEIVKPEASKVLDTAYTVLRDLVRGNPHIKRKVISVNDAREVARRLAEKQKQHAEQNRNVVRGYWDRDQYKDDDETDQMFSEFYSGMGPFHNRNKTEKKEKSSKKVIVKLMDTR